MKIKNYTEFLLESKRISIEMQVPNDIIEISTAFMKAGKEIFLVGGCVRDFLQKKSPKDYDLVTNALPEESKKILNGFRVSDEQGKNFGVLRIYTKDEPLGYEIASYRKDISLGRDTKGDDQKVEIGNHITIYDDCMRRDLTINALFYDLVRKEIVDIVGGIEDIKNGIIRAVGDPKQRFIEDRLRICRTFRFAIKTGGTIHTDTAKAIKEDNRLRGMGPKDDVSQERIWEEITKSYEQNGKYFYKYLDLLTEFDMWKEIFPGSSINTDISKCDSLYCYMANLFKGNNMLDRASAESKIISNYKIDGDTASVIVFLNRLLFLDFDNVTKIYKEKKRCEEKIGMSLVNIIIEWLDINKVSSKISIRFIDYKPSISAEKLKSLGFKDRELGSEIERLEILAFKELVK